MNNINDKEKNSANKKNLVVSKSRCPQNHRCPAIKYCPVEALSQQNYAAPIVAREKCIGCGICVKMCPMGALILE